MASAARVCLTEGGALFSASAVKRRNLLTGLGDDGTPAFRFAGVTQW